MPTLTAADDAETPVATPTSPPIHAVPAVPQLTVGQSVARGALALLSTQPLTWAASLVGTIVTPRLLGADTLGQVAVAATIGALAATATGLGISEYLVRRAAQHPDSLRRDAGVAFAAQMVVAILGTLAILALAPLFTSSLVDMRLLAVSLIPVLGAPAQTVLLSAFRGRERHQSYAWFNATSAIVALLAGPAVLVLGGDVIQAVAIANTLPIAFTLIAWKLSGVRPVIDLDRSLLPSAREFVVGGFPFLSWQLTLAAYGQVDRLLMGAFVSASEIGWYSAAYRIIGVVVFIPTLVVAPLFPALSRSGNDAHVLRRTIAQTLKLLTLIMVGLAVGTVVIAPVVPQLLDWPADFAQTVPLMMILALHEPFVAIDMVLGVVLMAIHRESRWVVVGVVATVFNIGVNLIAIPLTQNLFGNGGIGAATTTVLTEVVMFIGAVILIPKTLLDPGLIWHGVRMTACGLAAVAVGLWLPGVWPLPLAWLVACVAAGVVYLGGVTLLRVVTIQELSHLLGQIAPRFRTHG